jgi:hypothetical protein
LEGTVLGERSQGNVGLLPGILKSRVLELKSKHFWNIVLAMRQSEDPVLTWIADEIWQWPTLDHCVGLTFILWWSSELWQDANRLVGACWSVRRADFRQRFAGDYSPIDGLCGVMEKITPLL